MAVAKNKKRVMITIHAESLELAKSLLHLGSERMTLSELVEVSLYFFGKQAAADIKQKLEERKEQENAKS